MQTVTADSFSVGTLLGSYINLSSLLPIGFTDMGEFTLNNKYQIATNTQLERGPKLSYFGIGIGGAYNSDDTFLKTAFNPRKTNMDLYRPIPIRCIRVDEERDLDQTERNKYRLRRYMNVNGVPCICYYLKKIDFTSGLKYKQIDLASGAETNYEFNAVNMSPTPDKLGPNETLKIDTSTIIAYCTMKLEVEASEILEYINLMYQGDVRYAIVSEIGLYTGNDQEVQASDQYLTSQSYTESIYTMLNTHMTNCGIPLTHAGMRMECNYEITADGAISEA